MSDVNEDGEPAGLPMSDAPGQGSTSTDDGWSDWVDEMTDATLQSQAQSQQDDLENGTLFDRERWQPPYVSPEPESPMPQQPLESGQTSLSPHTANNQSQREDSEITIPPYRPLDPLWGFRIPRRPQAEQVERAEQVELIMLRHIVAEGCNCPISRDCVHKPGERKDCRIYAPDYSKLYTGWGDAAWQTSRMERIETPTSFRSVIVDMRLLMRTLDDIRQAGARWHEWLHDRIRRHISFIQENDMTEEILDEHPIQHTMVEVAMHAEDRGLPLPMDIIEDFTFLSKKWDRGDLSVDPMRGIIVEVRERNSRVGRVTVNKIRRIDRTWPYILSANFFGTGHLVNGQHWPLRICMLRDGAHRSMEAGICGVEGEGAQAVVMGKPKIDDYSDVDLGDKIWYVGTAAKAGEVEQDNPREYATDSTELLFTSIETGNPIRVFRSSKLPKINQLRPPHGLRYDGTYKAVAHELIEPERSVYRFEMHRDPGQGPIRVPFDGEEERGMQRAGRSQSL